MDLHELKGQWNQILSTLEAENRVAWLVFFDARLASLTESKLILDFSDAAKFSGDHSYVDSRSKFAPLLIEAIRRETGMNLEISW